MLRGEGHDPAVVWEPRPLQRIRAREDQAIAECDRAHGDEIWAHPDAVWYEPSLREMPRVRPRPSGEGQGPPSSEVLTYSAQERVGARVGQQTGVGRDHVSLSLTFAVASVEGVEELPQVVLPVAAHRGAARHLDQGFGAHGCQASTEENDVSRRAVGGSPWIDA